MIHARGSLIDSSSSSALSSTFSLLRPKLLPRPSRPGLLSPLVASSGVSPPKAKLLCLLMPAFDLIAPIRPPTMQPSSVFRIRLSCTESSTITGPFSFFHSFATSSSTLSPVPSSRHPEPQCLPIKVASACRAEALRVRLCFFVNVRKARGRRVDGGSRIGRIGLLTAGLKAGCAKGRFDAGMIGCAGVPNAGDDEKTFASCCLRIESIL